jgi:hypothetical protein
MGKVRITFEIDSKDLLDALKEVGRGFDLELRKDINLEELEETLSSDISNYFDWSMTEFLEEGLNNDLYREFYEEDEYEPENEDFLNY